ncbi:MAG: phage major capsid protein, partial [Patescibacteria group bacterium]|nr:phage major capsid protein [Patescibacteria group bacterium]
NNSNILWARAFNKPETWTGPTIWSSITTGNNTTGASYSGMDEFSTQNQSNTVKMVFHPAAYAQPVVVPGLDRAVNASKGAQAISLILQKMDEGKIAASMNLGQQIYAYGTGKDIDGVGLIFDNGANSSTYGDLSRSSYPGVNADVTAVSNNVITLDYLSSEADNVSAAGNNESVPTIGLMQPAVWRYIEGILQVMLGARYETTQTRGYNRVSGGIPIGTSVRPGDPLLGGAAGFNSITYRNRPLVADNQASSQTFYWANEYWLHGSRLLQDDLRNIDSNIKVTEGTLKSNPMPSTFQWRDFMKSINQNGELGVLLFAGNYYCRQPRRQGKLTGIQSN